MEITICSKIERLVSNRSLNTRTASIGFPSDLMMTMTSKAKMVIRVALKACSVKYSRSSNIRSYDV